MSATVGMGARTKVVRSTVFVEEAAKTCHFLFGDSTSSFSLRRIAAAVVMIRMLGRDPLVVTFADCAGQVLFRQW